MKFVLVDRISELVAGQRVVAHKALSLAEEYLADHFAAFPVLPGVLMLEAIVQASAWLVHATHNFRYSMVLLKEARNVTYKSFVAPGHVLTVESVAKEIGDETSAFAAVGRVGEREMVKAAVTLRHFNLADSDPSLGGVDQRIRGELRARFALIHRVRPAADSAVAAT